MLIMFVSTLLLCHMANVSRSERATQVARLELNTYEWTEGCIAQQIIVWEWNHRDQCYMATRYFLLGRESEGTIPFRTSGRKWRFSIRSPYDASKAVIFEADDFIVSETDYDVWNAAMARQQHRDQPKGASPG